MKIKKYNYYIIILFWLPHAILRYPAGIEWDAYHQIMQILGDYEMSSWWPLPSTYFLGGLYKVFLSISNNPNISIFLVVVVQTLICSFCFSYSLKTIDKVTENNVVYIIVLIIYCLSPIYARYLTSLVKDALFASFVVLFVSSLINYLEYNKDIVIVFISCLLTCLFRYNGIYIVYLLIPLIMIMAIIKKSKNYLKLFLVLLLCIMLNTTFMNYVDNCLNLHFTNSVMKYSLPFQQTARYCYYYSDELTQQEIESISKVLDIESVKQNYDPRLSDNVFGTYKNPSTQELLNYFKTWFLMFLKKPGVYISATFNNAYQFLFPNTVERTTGIYISANNDKIKYFQIPEVFKITRVLYRDIVEIIESLPIINIINNCGFSLIITIWMFKETIKKSV